MERFKHFLKQLSDQITNFWSQMTSTKRMIFVGFLSVIILGIGSILFFTKHDAQYEYLFADLSNEDSQAIATYLRKNNATTQFMMDEKGIKVPAEEVPFLRLKLSQEGLPSHGIIGWEKFDKQDFTRTEFEQQINKMRAIQGELSRTIMLLDGISSARVHIVSPKQSLFVQDQKDPTAAIYIKTKRNQALDQKQIKGIVNLVSRSVEGLKPENISIIDGEGKLLTKIEPTDDMSRMTKEMQEFKQNYEKELEEKIRTLVGRIVGHERVEAKVEADLDFTKEERTISDVDPERTAILSSTRTEQDISGHGLNPTGVPGAKSNVPQEQENVQQTGSGTKSKRGSETINYEPAKMVSRKTLPVGTIKRLSAAVLVDGRQIYPPDGSIPKFEARSEDEMKKIDEIIRGAIGFKEGRDEIKVHNLMFQLDPMLAQAITEKKKESREYISSLAIAGAVAMALILFFAFVVRPYFRWLAYDPERKAKQSIMDEFRPNFESSRMQQVQINEDVPFEKLTPQEQVLFLAKNEPKRTTEAIRMLLNPHQVKH